MWYKVVLKHLANEQPQQAESAFAKIVKFAPDSIHVQDGMIKIADYWMNQMEYHLSTGSLSVYNEPVPEPRQPQTVTTTKFVPDDKGNLMPIPETKEEISYEYPHRTPDSRNKLNNITKEAAERAEACMERALSFDPSREQEAYTHMLRYWKAQHSYWKNQRDKEMSYNNHFETDRAFMNMKKYASPNPLVF